ncbi:box C/D snoRNA protein 1 [Aplysia californica]|uniref:Box C/D snoRNA protein 1 n=1 Tax=Aplysia californica TaxID=6500 RepID=A0ABM1VP89_APLCA|nr:box C/D snoRNA protein 1 [Aplysia californica]XP_035824229.1 box C/D snoRNA protein 1 [Aplysia californica]XP_035824230.1 box C/D snoRNA protein 1 [Aplysia californica]XP_035824231.1 box C/D snoRNA protein 1 [Aplysia californica]
MSAGSNTEEKTNNERVLDDSTDIVLIQSNGLAQEEKTGSCASAVPSVNGPSHGAGSGPHSEDQDTLTNGDSQRSVHRRPTCEICMEEESKYTCPGCTMKTCSLQCVQAHKTKLSCSGERNKTAFMDLTQYSDANLLNDYRFLEDAERTLYSNKMVPLNRNRSQVGAPYHLNKRCKLLMTAALKRGVKLRILPQGFSKNRANSSFYTVKSDCIDWHIEWLFATGDSILKVNDKRVKETTILIDAVSKFTNAVQFPHLRKSLEGFQKADPSLCRYLLKVEGLPANMPRYFQLRPDLTLASNLMGQCLTEYPSIHVIPQSHSMDSYAIISKEDILHMIPSNARHMVIVHPELEVKEDLETKLLNPQSSVYFPSEAKNDVETEVLNSQSSVTDVRCS